MTGTGLEGKELRKSQGTDSPERQSSAQVPEFGAGLPTSPKPLTAGLLCTDTRLFALIRVIRGPPSSPTERLGESPTEDLPANDANTREWSVEPVTSRS